jgi:predicted Zn-dependent protease
MGHALGLGGHSPNPEDLMYGFIDTQAPAAGSEEPGELTARDRETLRLLYRRPMGARVSGARRAY